MSSNLNMIHTLKSIGDFNIIKNIGEGTFSCVLLANRKDQSKKQYAIKCIYPSSKPKRIYNEVRLLKSLSVHLICKYIYKNRILRE